MYEDTNFPVYYDMTLRLKNDNICIYYQYLLQRSEMAMKTNEKHDTDTNTE